MKVGFSLVFLTLIAITTSLDCSNIKFANGPSLYYEGECECQDNYLWSEEECVPLIQYLQVASSNTTIPCTSNQYNSSSGSCTYCSSSLSACLQCSLASGAVTPTCSLCQDSFYINSGGSCSKCNLAISNCYTCSSATICTACISNYLLNTAGTTCTAAPTCTVTNCAQCSASDSTICSSCLGQYVVSTDGKSCSLPACATGLTFNGVSCGCSSGYYLSTDGTSCIACVSNCLSCTSSTTCTSCTSGYSFSGTACTNCATKTGDPNCNQCLGTGCSGCVSGYSIINGVCSTALIGQCGVTQSDSGQQIACAYGCAQCSSQAVCTTCNSGFVLYQSVCYPCGANCQTCSYDSTQSTTVLATQTCQTCFTGYSISSGVCSNCADSNCQSCTNPNYCTTCIPLYAPSNGICKSCCQGCLQCTTNGPGLCDTGNCKQGYGYLSVSQVCIKCISGCSQCNNNIFACDSCQSGQFNDTSVSTSTNLVCTLCPSSCATCTSLTNCQTCSYGYHLSTSGTSCVLNCIFPCSTCTDGSPSLCLSCYGGYALSGTSCNADLSCNALSSCTVCPNGYAILNNQCSTCQVSSISNCISCLPSSLTTCQYCATGYYISGNSCVACPTGCSICASSNFCYSASSGYLITSTTYGSFSQCDSNCLTCANSLDSCTSCDSKHTLVSSYCLSNQKIQADYVLSGTSASDTSLTPTSFQPYLEGFLNNLAVALKIRRKSITFKNVVSSSVNVSSVVSIESNNTATSVLSATQTSLSSGSSVNGIYVQSSTITASGFSATSSANLGLILGVSIPLVVLFIGLLVFIAFKLVGDETYKSVQATEKGVVSTDQNYEAGI